MYLLQTLRSAGIKFWMLTGDKYSTALQIATACNLKSSDERTLLYLTLWTIHAIAVFALLFSVTDDVIRAV